MGADTRPKARDDGTPVPLLLAFLCVESLLVPYYMVPPGPLKSNGAPVRLLELTLLGLVILTFVLPRTTFGRRLTFNPGIAFILTFCFLRLITLGVGQTRLVDPDDINKFTWYGPLTFFAYAGVALYCIYRLNSYRERSVILGCIAVGITISSVIGVLQNLADVNLLPLLEPPGFIRNVEGSLGQTAASIRHGAIRASGTALHPIEFSVVAAAGVFVNIHFAQFAERKAVRWAAAAAAIVCLFGMAGAISRTGALALLTGTLVYVWSLRLRTLAGLSALGALAFVGMYLGAPGTLNALTFSISTANPDEDGSVLSRVVAVQRVAEIFHENPVFGLGLTTTATSYKKAGYLDNEWLGQLLVGGLVGLAGMVALALGGIIGIAAALRGARGRRERDQAFAVASMWSGLLMSSFTFDLFAFQQATLLIFILLGVLWSYFTIPLDGLPARPPTAAVAAADQNPSRLY